MKNKALDQTIFYQRVEALFMLAASIYFYTHLHFSLIWFVVFLFSMDVFMIGYAFDKVLGAKFYNIGHTYIVPAVLLVIGVASDHRLVLAAGIIWAAHISMDRALGYGLKHKTGFKDTHLGHIG
jgi:hypothetical protein